MTTKVSMNMPTRDLLVIAYAFPPMAYAGTFRSQRLCKYLARMGHNIHVLTIKEQDDLQNDPTLLEAVRDQVTIHRTSTLDPWRWYQNRKKKLITSQPGRLLNKLICFLLKLINQPDHMIFWIPFAVKRGFALCRASKNIVLYTTSPPHSAHWIGYLLKKLCNRKWIADFRDPIFGNIASANWNPYERLVHGFLEKRILHNADAVIVNTNAVRKELLARYPGRNIHYVGNSFDPEDFQSLSPEKFPIFTLAHVGSIDGFRKIDALLAALNKMHEAGRITPANFRFLLVGLNNPSVSEQVRQSGVAQYIEFRPMVAHREALSIMKRSHLLLLKGFGEGCGPDGGNQIPCKLFEYLGSGNPILYLGPQGSETATIIASLQAGYLVEDNAAQVEETLTCALKKHLRNPGDVQSPFPEARLDGFTSAAMAARIHAISEAL